MSILRQSRLLCISEGTRLPLRFRASLVPTTTIYQVTESTSFANGGAVGCDGTAMWNQALQHYYGDYFRCGTLAKIADVFKCKLAIQRQICLMADNGRKLALEE